MHDQADQPFGLRRKLVRRCRCLFYHRGVLLCHLIHLVDGGVDFLQSGRLLACRDGDGVDTFAIRRGNTFYVKNDVAGGPADQTFAYGRAGDEVLVGDWDGDGVDTFIARRGATFFVKNSISAGPADETRILGTGSELAYSVFVD